MKFSDEHANWLRNDELFFGQLMVGREGEAKVAGYLLRNGVPVQLPPLRVRDNVDDRYEFRNQADLYAGPWGKPYRIEVKHINASFSGVGDYPYEDVLIVTTNKWRNIKRSEEQPMCFVIVSQKTSAMIWVDTTWTQHQWFKKTVRDNVRGMDVEIWAIKRHLCHPMSKLVEWLKSE